MITSDFARMRILDLGGDRTPYEFATRDLVKEIDRFGFLAGYSARKYSNVPEHEVDIIAARLMGKLYEELIATGLEDEDVSVYLVRILFLLFGDDTGLWQKNLFLEFIETRTSPDGSDLGAQLASLFQALDRDEARRPPTLDELLARFPYVNGGLFSARVDIPSFSKPMRDHLIECCHVDWGAIVPAIFGSLFQAVKSKQARRELGEHYTSEAQIQRVIGPLFLDGLKAEYDQVFHHAAKLKKLRDRLGDLVLFDPSCGCANFLLISYRELRTLELNILRRLAALTGSLSCRWMRPSDCVSRRRTSSESRSSRGRRTSLRQRCSSLIIRRTWPWPGSSVRRQTDSRSRPQQRSFTGTLYASTGLSWCHRRAT